jgi:hypothetical protein
MVSTIATPRRRSAWRPSRRITDYVIRYTIPGRHHTLDSRSLAALLLIREARA